MGDFAVLSTRWTIVVLALTICALSAFWAAFAQDSNPFISKPIRPPPQASVPTNGPRTTPTGDSSTFPEHVVAIIPNEPLNHPKPEKPPLIELPRLPDSIGLPMVSAEKPEEVMPVPLPTPVTEPEKLPGLPSRPVPPKTTEVKTDPLPGQTYQPPPSIPNPDNIPEIEVVSTKPEPAPEKTPANIEVKPGLPMVPEVHLPGTGDAPFPVPPPLVEPQVIPKQPTEPVVAPIPDPIPNTVPKTKVPEPVLPTKNNEVDQKQPDLFIEPPPVVTPSPVNLPGKKESIPPVDTGKKDPAPLVLDPAPDLIKMPFPKNGAGNPKVGPAPVAEPPEIKGPTRPPAFQLVNPIRRAQPPTEESPSVGDVKPAPLETVLMAGPQAAQMVLEKRGQASVRLGQNIHYLIVIRNAGPNPAQQLRVEDEVPSGALVVATTPPARRIGNRLIWDLASLASGSEKQLRVELQPQQVGELASETTANVILSTPTRTRVIGGDSGSGAPNNNALIMNVVSPKNVRLKQPADFEVEVINQGREKLTGLVLQVTMPPGLHHPQGDKLEANVEDLAPNTKKSYTIHTTALLPGRHVLEVRMFNQAGQNAVSQGEVIVTTQGVFIQQAPSTRLALHRDGEMRLEVTNYESRPLYNVTVTNQLPEGVEYLQASDRGIFRQESRSVYWLIEAMQPGQTKTLSVKVQGAKNGQFSNQVVVKAQHLEERRFSGQVEVEGSTDLVVKITKKDEALELGREAVYEIRLINQGSIAATKVQLQLALTEGLTPRLAQGPTVGRVLGQQVQFATLASLAPGGQAVFHLQARGDSVGDRRVRAQVTCDQIRQPLNKEDRTVVYQEK